MSNLKYVSAIIEAAGKGPLPMIALGLLVLSFIALKWFGKDGSATRIFIFLTILALLFLAVWSNLREKDAKDSAAHPVKPLDKRNKAPQGTIYFALDSKDLNPEAATVLDDIASKYSITRQRLIRLEGHTDRMGSALLNQELSDRFAATAKDYLVAQGIPPQAISVKGFGEGRPISSSLSEREPRDRRVDIYFDD